MPHIGRMAKGGDPAFQFVGVVAAHAFDAGSPRSYAAIFHMGGAVARMPMGATAYAGRDVAHNIVIDGVWLPEQSGEHAATEAINTTWQAVRRIAIPSLMPASIAG